jgi:hypothetical protein
LLEGFQDFTSWAKDMSEGYRRTVDLNGDMGELDTKRRSNQLITPNKATITPTNCNRKERTMDELGKVERKDRYVCKAKMTCKGIECDGFLVHRTDYYGDGSAGDTFYFDVDAAVFWKLMEANNYKWSNEESSWVKLTKEPVPAA